MESRVIQLFFKALRTVNNRSIAALTILYCMKYEHFKRFVKRAVVVGGLSMACLLNFGLDLEGRERRRQLLPGVSRLLILSLCSWLYGRKDDDTRFFKMGLCLRVLPVVTFGITRGNSLFSRFFLALMGAGAYGVARQALPKHSVLAESLSHSRYEEEASCSICLEDGVDYVLRECEHSFHRPCLERWLTLNDFCPMCKVGAVSALLFFSHGSGGCPTQPRLCGGLSVVLLGFMAQTPLCHGFLVVGSTRALLGMKRKKELEER